MLMGFNNHLKLGSGLIIALLILSVTFLILQGLTSGY